MSQQCMDFYLRQRKETGKRKGSVERDALPGGKVLLLEAPLTPVERGSTYDSVRLLTTKKEALLQEKGEEKIHKPKLGKAVIKLSFDGARNSPPAQRRVVRSRESSPQMESRNPDGGLAKRAIRFVKRGVLSPKKKVINRNGDITTFLRKQEDAGAPEPCTTKEKAEKVSQCRKELSLGDIKKCVMRSSRINELKNSISKLNKGFDKLNQLNASPPGSSDSSALKEFRSIELIVPVSPAKQSPCKLPGTVGPLMSPRKTPLTAEPLMSPRKGIASPIKSPIKTPAYERYASLVTTPKDSLPLPHHYRWLGEIFRSLEQIVSMKFARKETITFSKVRHGVQEMLRRNFTEKHLRQIKHLVPNMYSFSLEKVKNFGATAKRDEYELVLKPCLESTGETMSPAVILTRQRIFFNTLLDIAKEHHKKFLASLDPPMIIPHNELKRWHPDFDLERIADVIEDNLPEPPNVEKFSTAQDVLSHFREKFNCNTKMEKALMKLAEAKKRGLTAEEQKVTRLNADGTDKLVSSPMPGVCEIRLKQEPNGNEPLNPALKGVPKALLEKVRARQAAKALESMKRTPEQEKDALTYQRLPDIARLLRNLYVTEKKSVLSLDAVVSKMSNSFKIKISNEELVKHIRLLAEEVRHWLTFYEFNKTEYLKMAKDANLNVIMTHLGGLATKHSLC